MNNIKANETIVSRSVVDLMEEMLKSVENEQEENQLINTATNAIEINNEEQKNEIINTKEQTNSIVDIKKDNNEVINTKVEHKSQNNKDESNDDNINEEKKKRKEMNKKKFNEKTKEVQRGSKRKMIESKEECRLSSSSDESITILGHSDHNTNPQSLFTDYSPICLRINRDEKGNKRLKNKCQSFKKHTLCVIKSMIGPQSPASHNGMFIICPPAKLTCEIETFSEKMKRMRRTAVRKEVEELVQDKMELQKTLMMKRKELLKGSKAMRETKKLLEKKMTEVRLLSAELMSSVSKVHGVLFQLKKMAALKSIE